MTDEEFDEKGGRRYYVESEHIAAGRWVKDHRRAGNVFISYWNPKTGAMCDSSFEFLNIGTSWPAPFLSLAPDSFLAFSEFGPTFIAGLADLDPVRLGRMPNLDDVVKFLEREGFERVHPLEER